MSSATRLAFSILSQRNFSSFPLSLISNHRTLVSSTQTRRQLQQENAAQTPTENYLESSSIDSEYLFKLNENDDNIPKGASNSLNKSQQQFRYGEMILCRVTETPTGSGRRWSPTSPPTVSNKLIRLEPGRVFRMRYFDLFHEHILNMTSLVFYNVRYEFKRPSLYDYVVLKVI